MSGRIGLRAILFVLFVLVSSGFSQQPSGRNGNYLIEECYMDTDHISDVIDKVRDHIDKAIQYLDDMKNGTDTVIYNAFLKGVDPAVIKGVLNRVAKAGPIFNAKTKKKESPVVLCVARDNPNLSSASRDCEQSGALAFIRPDLPFIYLCRFFLSEDVEPTNDDCSALNSRRSKLSPSTMQVTQTMMLLHELVHMYLLPALLEPEVYEINEVMALPADHKAINAASYAYFVGNVVAECDEFPRKYYRQDHDDVL
ncbi:MAG: hypothetical protein Q9170_002991 [Blastenia crenularia]